MGNCQIPGFGLEEKLITSMNGGDESHHFSLLSGEDRWGPAEQLSSTLGTWSDFVLILPQSEACWDQRMDHTQSTEEGSNNSSQHLEEIIFFSTSTLWSVVGGTHWLEFPITEKCGLEGKSFAHLKEEVRSHGSHIWWPVSEGHQECKRWLTPEGWYHKFPEHFFSKIEFQDKRSAVSTFSFLGEEKTFTHV